MAGHADQDAPDNSLVLRGILANAQYPRTFRPAVRDGKWLPYSTRNELDGKIDGSGASSQRVTKGSWQMPGSNVAGILVPPLSGPQTGRFFDALDEATR